MKIISKYILLCFITPIMFSCGNQDSKPTQGGLATAREMMAAQDFGKARVVINKVLSDDPDLPEAYIVLGQIALSQYDLKAAFDAYKKAVSLDPRQFEGQLGLAKLLMIGGSLGEAIERVDISLAQQPANQPALELKGSMLLAKKDSKGAAEIFERLLKNNIVVSEIHYSIVAQQYLLDDVEKAENLLLQGLAHYPKGVLLRESLVELYAKNGDCRAAEDQIRALMEIDPSRIKYSLDLADILLKTSRKTEADLALQNLVDQATGETEFEAVADFFISKDLLEEAEAVLELGIQKNAGTVRLRLRLGQILLDTGRYEKAAELAEHCISNSRRPDSIEALESKSLLARARMLQGRPSK